jgi:ABC-type lipoprotein export system ATPase subunit
MGHSGSGKSTLINILGLIDSFDSGKYELYEKRVEKFNDAELSNLRMKNIGFVFQEFHLNSTLKAYENVIVPMLINKDIDPKDRKKRAIDLLESVGLGERIDHFPNELSGGEQQRVAIARALANNPSIILADEPTGNLDEKNEQIIFSNLKELSMNGKCVIVVSHSNEVKKYANKVFKIVDGKLIGDKE